VPRGNFLISRGKLLMHERTGGFIPPRPLLRAHAKGQGAN
jgi:hypothetical protein